jgi:two-component system response regulator AtoC
MVRAKILVVDDEKLIRWSLKQKLEKENYVVFTASSGEEAMEMFHQEHPDLILQDIKLPGMSGLEILKQVKKLRQQSLVIMMTAYGDIQTSVKAMKLGAYDFVEKPFDFEIMKLTVAKALETVKLKKEVHVLKTQQQTQHGLSKIMGRTPAIQGIIRMVKKIAGSEATTVLLQGESGTGKDLVAKAIHYESSRAGHPYMEIYCTALHEGLIESELFGHEKGAFTDAKEMKKGLFEVADGGTILLDEIGDMPFNTQAKLLRVIEGKTFKRLGGTKDILVDVRIIAATNKDLKQASESGAFRTDLYYRLKVFPIFIPPLRERTDDIPLLVQHFVSYYDREKKVRGVSGDALEIMMRYPWPGNVRELKNVIERAVILENEEEILPEHLPMEITMPTEISPFSSGNEQLPPLGNTLSEAERALIKQALEKSRGNQIHTAKLLGLSRDTLRYRMKKYGLL